MDGVFGRDTFLHTLTHPTNRKTLYSAGQGEGAQPPHCKDVSWPKRFTKIAQFHGGDTPASLKRRWGEKPPSIE